MLDRYGAFLPRLVEQAKDHLGATYVMPRRIEMRILQRMFVKVREVAVTITFRKIGRFLSKVRNGIFFISGNDLKIHLG